MKKFRVTVLLLALMMVLCALPVNAATDDVTDVAVSQEKEVSNPMASDLVDVDDEALNPDTDTLENNTVDPENRDLANSDSEKLDSENGDDQEDDLQAATADEDLLTAPSTGVYTVGDKAENGVWYLYKNGAKSTDTAVGKNKAGYWYCKDGKVDFTFSGFAKTANGTWYIEKGMVRTGVSGLVKTPEGKWANLVEGKVETAAALVKNSVGWFYVGTDGYVDFTKTGLITNSLGTWSVIKGKVDFTFTGFMNDTVTGTWYCVNGKVDKALTGVYKDMTSGKWGYIKAGKLQTGAVSLVKNSNGWWYIGKDGYVDFTANTIASNANGSWVIRSGKIDFSYTGLASDGTNTWYCTNGKVDTSKEGLLKDPKSGKWAYLLAGKLQTGSVSLQKNSNGWFYVGKDGYVDFTANTVASNANGWWAVTNGKVNFKFTGLASNSSGSWYCKNGKVDFTVSGVIKDPATGAWCYLEKGKLQTGKTDVAKNANGWWYITEEGYVDFDYSGFAANANGTWYIVKGKVDFTVSGVVKDQISGKWGYISLGQLRGGPAVKGNAYGSWYIDEDGYVDFTYSGDFTYNGYDYTIVKGKVDVSNTYNLYMGIKGDAAADQIYIYLRQHGLTKAAAVGVLANMQAESGFDAAIIEIKYGYGHGLIQWSFERWDNLQAAAKKAGVSWTDPEFQMDFFMAEMPGWFQQQSKYQLGYAFSWDQYCQMTDYREATKIFEMVAEQAGTVRWDARYAAADKFYNRY